MARLSDVPKVYRTVRLVPFFRRVWDEVCKDNLFVWASALAYSWLFAIFPFFIFLLSLIPYLPERTRDLTKTEIQHLVTLCFPNAANSMLWTDIADNSGNLLHQHVASVRMLCIGLIIALWAASGGTSMTMSAMDRCYELDRSRSIVWQRLLAMTLTIFVAILLLAIMCLLPLASGYKESLIQRGLHIGNWWLFLFDVARWILALVLMVLLLTLIYYNGPAIHQHFHFVTPGAVFVIVVWVLLGLLFKLYVQFIGARGYANTYGTVGSVAILLLFFYIDALVLLIGAEINSELDFEILRVRRGSCDFRHAQDVINGAPTSC